MPRYRTKALVRRAVVLAFLFGGAVPGAMEASLAQKLRDIPRDATRVYYESAADALTALPFETNTTSLDPFAIARKDKVSYAEVKGANSATVLADRRPRFYVFVADKMDPPPHQLVRLSSKKNTRRFTVVRIKGRKGYSPLEAESVRLDYRILERLTVAGGRGRFMFLNYMEIQPRVPLPPGEYAVIGDSLLDIATFRIQFDAAQTVIEVMLPKHSGRHRAKRPPRFSNSQELFSIRARR